MTFLEQMGDLTLYGITSPEMGSLIHNTFDSFKRIGRLRIFSR